MGNGSLLDAIANGDRVALRALYFQYSPCLARLLSKCTSSRHSVEAIIIETFRVIWESARTSHCPTEVSTWVFGIAYTVARQTLGDELRTSTDLSSNGRSTDAAMYRLPLEQRITFLLAYQLGLSLEAIAEITRCPRSTVALRMADAREAIRRAPTNFNQRATRAAPRSRPSGLAGVIAKP
jgi:RNA polymerase sigma-70 factor (ECF subfamily)